MSSKKSDAGRAAEAGIGTVSHFEAQQEEQLSLAKKRRRERIRQAFETAHEELADGNLAVVQQVIAEHVLDELDVSHRKFADYEDEFDERDEPFHSRVLRRIMRGEEIKDHQDLAGALQTLETIAAIDGPLPTTVQTKQPLVEYRHQVGERYLSGGQRVSKVLEAIDTDGDLKATLLTGGQGAGKSAFSGTLVEDRLARGHSVVDLVDFHKGENVMYDQPADPEEELQDVRAEMGLDVGFEDDYEPPDVSVLAPLTHGLADARIPRDTESGEFVLQPFTIPADDLTFRQIVMLLPHTTKTQQGYIKSAHQTLTVESDSWTLYELADTVRHRTNAGDSVSDRIERALETVQQKSFIRDSEADHLLDWDEIMAEERHVTAFTVHMMREKSDKLAILSYLLDRLYDARQELLRRHRLEEYPPLTVVMRELHTIAPRTKSEQDSESTTESYLVETLAELMALMRHVNMDIIADTQKFKQQLSPRVSKLFHRIYCFKGQKPDIQDVFRTRVSNTDPASTVASYETGVCALVSDEGYRLPIRTAPPRFHHLDASQDGGGLSYRVKNQEHEELAEAPWTARVPPRLRFGGKFDAREEFWHQQVTVTDDRTDFIPKQTLTDLYREWAAEEGYKKRSHQALCKWVKQNTVAEERHPTVDGSQEASWAGVLFRQTDTTRGAEVDDAFISTS